MERKVLEVKPGSFPQEAIGVLRAVLVEVLQWMDSVLQVGFELVVGENRPSQQLLYQHPQRSLRGS